MKGSFAFWMEFSQKSFLSPFSLKVKHEQNRQNDSHELIKFQIYSHNSARRPHREMMLMTSEEKLRKCFFFHEKLRRLKNLFRHISGLFVTSVSLVLSGSGTTYIKQVTQFQTCWSQRKENKIFTMCARPVEEKFRDCFYEVRQCLDGQ